MSLESSPTDLALSYFMHIYAPISAFCYAREIWTSFDSSQPSSDLLLAPSLLLLSGAHRSLHFRHLAYEYYSEAIQRVNTALADPQLALLDDTILAVLSLSLFELWTLEGRQSLWKWNAHIKGCAELLLLRGRKQFNSPLGRHLLLHAFSHIKASCAQKGTELKHDLVTLYEDLTGLTEPIQPAIQLGVILDGLKTLRLNVENLSLKQRVQAAIQQDQRLSTYFAFLNKTAPFELIEVTTSLKCAPVFRNHVHRYVSYRAARHWNLLRTLRISLGALIHHCRIGKLGSEDSPKKDVADRVESNMTAVDSAIRDILYSVPFLLDNSVGSYIAAQSLIYPLAIISMSPLSLPCARSFASNKLAYIEREHNLVYAAQAQSMVHWSHDLEDRIYVAAVM